MGIESQTDSSIYMCRALLVIVSKIMNMRKLLSSEHFKICKFANVKTSVLSNTDVADQLIKLIRGASDAIEKRYLRALILTFGKDSVDRNTVIEAYTIMFRYSIKGPSMRLSFDQQNLKRGEFEYSGNVTVDDQFKTLIDRIDKMLLSMDPLPNGIRPNFKLIYYDDRTPYNYEPPGFRQSKCMYRFESSAKGALRLGDIGTKQHRIFIKNSICYTNNTMANSSVRVRSNSTMHSSAVNEVDQMHSPCTNTSSSVNHARVFVSDESMTTPFVCYINVPPVDSAKIDYATLHRAASSLIDDDGSCSSDSSNIEQSSDLDEKRSSRFEPFLSISIQ